MRINPVTILLPLALLACTSDAEVQSRLEIACAVKKCECVSKEAVVFSTPERQDVLWQSNGNAYCPEGFALAEYKGDKKEPGGIKMPRYTDPVTCYDTAERCKNKEDLKRLQ